jgi:hypothetical protein
MKKLFVSFTLFFAFLQFTQAQPVLQDTNVAWSILTYPVHEIFNSPDGRFIFVNQNEMSMFSKIDAMTGAIIDSVKGKGLIFGISPDWRYLYTRGGTFESIKKLDINTYSAVDSINDMQDIKDTNKYFGGPASVWDAKISQYGKIFVAIGYGKYIFAILDTDNLEIINKKLTTDISDSVEGAPILAVSPNGNNLILHVVSHAFDKFSQNWHQWDSVYVFDTKTLQPQKIIFHGLVSQIWDLKFSPDGKYLGLNWEGIFNLYNTQDFSLYKNMNISHAIDFSNDSKIIALSIGSEIHFYNLSDFSELCTKTAYSTTALKFTNDDKFIYDYNRANIFLTKSKSCAVVGVSNLNPIKNVVLSVNPITNELIIQNLPYNFGIFDYQITDVKGRIIIAESIEILNNQSKISIKNLTNGVYFLTLNNVSYKFMVAR